MSPGSGGARRGQQRQAGVGQALCAAQQHQLCQVLARAPRGQRGTQLVAQRAAAAQQPQRRQARARAHHRRHPCPGKRP